LADNIGQFAQRGHTDQLAPGSADVPSATRQPSRAVSTHDMMVEPALARQEGPPQASP